MLEGFLNVQMKNATASIEKIGIIGVKAANFSDLTKELHNSAQNP
jgi:hypothetical protein